MTSPRKILDAVLRAQSDANTRFEDLCVLLKRLGFSTRVKGSHHLFWRQGILEIINLQPLPGGKAKPYQVKQVRQIVTAYHLSLTP